MFSIWVNLLVVARSIWASRTSSRELHAVCDNRVQWASLTLPRVAPLAAILSPAPVRTVKCVPRFFIAGWRCNSLNLIRSFWGSWNIVEASRWLGHPGDDFLVHIKHFNLHLLFVFNESEPDHVLNHSVFGDSRPNLIGLLQYLFALLHIHLYRLLPTDVIQSNINDSIGIAQFMGLSVDFQSGLRVWGAVIETVFKQ